MQGYFLFEVLMFVWLLPFIAAVGAFCLPKRAASISILANSFATMGAAYIFWVSRLPEFTTKHTIFPWLNGSMIFPFHIGFYLDSVSAWLLLLITSISTCVLFFSSVYMRHEKNATRYWATLGLFISAMLGLVVADNFLQLFMAWELVGLCSYLLIGFWQNKPGVGQAATVAFITNRVGDVCLLAAICLLAAQTGSLDLTRLDASTLTTPNLITSLLLIGAMTKSAQFPLQFWLPDAMVGPTTASALIHAATMVAAGVYLLVRVFPLFGAELLMVMSCIGIGTALGASLWAIFQADIKRILAYSTIAQLGLMFLAVGAGAPEVALFHLSTHAFFKCGLFLCVARILLYLHEQHFPDAQNIYALGGLKKHLPLVYAVFIVFAAALAGLPFTSGYLSKEALFSIVQNNIGLLAGLWLVAVCTAFYLVRLISLTFWGNNPNIIVAQYKNVSENNMQFALIVLAGTSIGFVFALPNPLGLADVWLLDNPLDVSLGLTLFALSAPAVGIASGILAYKKQFYFAQKIIKVGGFFRAKVEHWFARPFLTFSQILAWIDTNVVDGLVRLVAWITVSGEQWGKPVAIAHWFAWIDTYIIDGLVNLCAQMVYYWGRTFRSWQGGSVQTYLIISLAFLLLVLYLFI